MNRFERFRERLDDVAMSITMIAMIVGCVFLIILIALLFIDLLLGMAAT